MAQNSAYSNEEWVDLINKAVRYLRTHAEADGTFIGSLKDAMADFMSGIPHARIEGPSLAATLPLTGLVSNGGRSGGHTIWSVADRNITIDDWVRVTYLRRNKKAEEKQQKIRDVPRVAQRAAIDESLTGHPEVVVTPERDYKTELEELRNRYEELIERWENEVERRKELERLLSETSGNQEEVIKLKRLLRFIADHPETIELFQAGRDIGGA